MTFTYLTFALPFDAARLEDVDTLLESEGRELSRDGRLRKALSGRGIHFLSMTTVPGGSAHPAFLVLESTHEHDRDTAMRTLADTLRESLTAVLQKAGSDAPQGDLAALLRNHAVETGTGLFSVPGLTHCGVPGITIDRIFKEQALASALRAHVGNDRTGASALGRLRAIRAAIARDPAHAEMLQPEDVSFLYPRPDAASGPAAVAGMIGRGIVNFGWPLLVAASLTAALIALWVGASSGLWVGIGMGMLALAAWGVLSLAAAVAIYAGLRRRETTDEPDDTPPDFSVLSRVMQIEDDGDVNHLAAISVMKPGRLRRFTLRLAFWVVGELARHRFRPGFLGELGTIHSARWVLLPGTDKLLFFSNYGGSWESYLEDFITKASNGLTGVWSNTRGFPRTANLFFGGASDGDRFKRWARRQQRPSLFWYRAYPNKTTHTVRLNAALRHGLIAAATEDEAADWFALFGSRPRRAASLQTGEIQKILFGGMGDLRDTACHLIRLPQTVAAAREWLRGVEPQVSFGDDKPGETATILALTVTGLRRLGLGEADLTGFPAAFRQGMAEPRRARHVLMDTGDDNPESWVWGRHDAPVDAALYVLSRVEDDALENQALGHSRNAIAALEAAGGAVISTIETKRLCSKGPFREPFGFVDGVSQPIIRGTPLWPKRQNSRDVVEPGEFILGYPDNRGHLPHSPTVPAGSDPGDHLPAHRAEALDDDWPDFRPGTPRSDRDLGKNGSYLVIRQMQQDVERFDRQALEMAQQIIDHPARPHGLDKEQLATWIKAKAVGRWPNGTSLTRHPFAPGSGSAGEEEALPDNEFLHGSEDPEGTRCPFSAHIRRTNPRDSFVPGSEEQLSIVNRHRILRVGRSYESGPASSRRQGLLFMCLNADIERQFEFVQQTWAMSRQFHGLTDEVDTVIGRGQKGGQLTIPTSAGPLIVTGFEDVVRVRGGAYFFLPSKSAIAFLARPPAQDVQ